MQEYLSRVIITDDDHAVLLSWNFSALTTFVEAVNEWSDNLQHWLSQIHGNVSVDSVIEDIVNHLAEVAGGRWEYVLLAPNNLSEFANIIACLWDIQVNQFIQDCMIDAEESKKKG